MSPAHGLFPLRGDTRGCHRAGRRPSAARRPAASPGHVPRARGGPGCPPSPRQRTEQPVARHPSRPYSALCPPTQHPPTLVTGAAVAHPFIQSQPEPPLRASPLSSDIWVLGLGPNPTGTRVWREPWHWAAGGRERPLRVRLGGLPSVAWGPAPPPAVVPGHLLPEDRSPTPVSSCRCRSFLRGPTPTASLVVAGPNPEHWDTISP